MGPILAIFGQYIGMLEVVFVCVISPLTMLSYILYPKIDFFCTKWNFFPLKGLYT